MSKANEIASKAENETIVAFVRTLKSLKGKITIKLKRIENPRIGIDNIY
jgi:hypothetical protein